MKAQMNFANTIYHNIHEGKLHRGGTIELTVKEKSESNFMAYMKYTLKKKWYVPVPEKVLSGDINQPMPIAFQQEEGYLDLEDYGSYDMKDAKLIHLGREDVNDYENCHKIQIIPRNKKWKGILYYHPEVSSLGWVKSEITLLNIPTLGNYEAISTLK
jgi:hypothetical protein